MPAALVVDDALLLSVLADGPPAEIRAALRRGALFTTISWYYRLARATQDPAFNGKLSAALGALPTRRQALVDAALDNLPSQIGLLDIRRVMPVMRRLDAGRRLNFLTAEALAVAASIDAGIRVTTESPLLFAGAAVLDIEVRVLSV
ncbi:MAG TPA: hypothetical protein VGB03_09480 [Acidimicrobiales bacterium]